MKTKIIQYSELEWVNERVKELECKSETLWKWDSVRVVQYDENEGMRDCESERVREWDLVPSCCLTFRHFYINLEFETCGAGIWEKKINLGPSNVHCTGLQARDKWQSLVTTTVVILIQKFQYVILWPTGQASWPGDGHCSEDYFSPKQAVFRNFAKSFCGVFLVSF